MKNVLKNKPAMILTLVLIVIAAGATNWYTKSHNSSLPVISKNMNQNTESTRNDPNNLPTPEEEQTRKCTLSTKSTEEYIENARMEKERGRSQTISILRDTISNPNTSQKDKEIASQSISKLTSRIELEPVIENILKAKGFSQIMLCLGENDASVIIKCSQLDRNQVAQIKDIIIDKAKLKANNIKIIPIE